MRQVIRVSKNRRLNGAIGLQSAIWFEVVAYTSRMIRRLDNHSLAGEVLVENREPFDGRPVQGIIN
jgi:hypothetical protein